MSHISVIERLIRGDIMYDPIGLLDTTHLRFPSPRSAFKMLLDSGWLPDAAGDYQGGHANAHFTQAIVDAAQALGIPRKSAELNVHTYQLIVRCKRRVVAPSSPARSRISVIASGDDPGQLDLNILRSPGLREIDAELVITRGAVTAAQGIADGASRASRDWLLCCHDDVYFPRGTGFALLDILDRIAPADAATTLLGWRSMKRSIHFAPG